MRGEHPQHTEQRKISKREVKEVTAKYLAGDLTFKPVELEALCTCRSFDYPHRPTAHSQLPRGDRDWRRPSETRIYQRLAQMKIYNRDLR